MNLLYLNYYVVVFKEQGKNLTLLQEHQREIMTEEGLNKDNAFDTIPKLMLYHSKHRGHSPANRQKEYGIWKSWAWPQALDEVWNLASGLARLSFQRGDKSSVIGNNRLRLYWSMVATQVLGGILVSLYQDSVTEEMLYVLVNADVKYAVLKNHEQTDKLLEIKDHLPKLEHICFEEPRGMRNYSQGADSFII